MALWSQSLQEAEGERKREHGVGEKKRREAEGGGKKREKESRPKRRGAEGGLTHLAARLSLYVFMLEGAQGHRGRSAVATAERAARCPEWEGRRQKVDISIRGGGRWDQESHCYALGCL